MTNATSGASGATVRWDAGDTESRRQLLSGILANARASGRRAIDEVSCKRIVAACGIAVPKGRKVATAEEVRQAIRELRPPWALKIVSADVLHKTEAGGVRTGLESADEVVTAMYAMTDRMRAQDLRIDGYLLEEMAPAGVEIVIGGVRDASFGWMVMFGLGGILVEYLQDVAFRICPITRVDAAEMIGEIKTHAVLEGARGRARIDHAALIDALLAIGGESGLLAEAGKEIAEIDLNPLLASEQGIVAVDARIVLANE